MCVCVCDVCMCVSPEESLSFWQGMSEMGLVGEVVSSIRTELLALLRGVEQRGEQALLHHTGGYSHTGAHTYAQKR